MAQTVANDMVKDKEKALKAAQNAKSKGGVTIAEKIASEQERKANIQNAEQELAIWQAIASVPEARQQAMAEAQAQAEEEAEQGEAGDIKPIGKGVFGNIYDQFKGKAKEAIAFLFKRKEGEAIGALHHPKIGEISLVWGNPKAGLEKIARKHAEVLDDLQEIINQMDVVSSSENRIKLESDTHFAVVSREYLGQPRDQWLLTAYEKKNSAFDNTTDTDETSDRGKQNDTATLQNTVSNSKDTTSSQNNNEIEDKNVQEAEELEASDKAINDGNVASNTIATEVAVGMLKDAGVEVVEATDAMAEAVLAKGGVQMMSVPEAKRRADAIENLTPININGNTKTKEELKEDYKNLPSVNKAGNKIQFYVSAFKKIYKEGGLFGQIIPQLDKILEQSVLAYSEADNLGGTKRPDGTIHKAHPNVVSFDNYVGKVTINGKE